MNARLPGVLARTTADAAGTGGPFRVLERFHLAIALVTIIAATVFLLALTIMLVDERRETVGVLRLIGLPTGRILTQVAIEGLLVAGVGSAFGLAAGRGLRDADQPLLPVALRHGAGLRPHHAGGGAAMRGDRGAARAWWRRCVASWALLRRNALRLARR